MKHLSALTFVILLSAGFAQAQTQSEMNAQAAADFMKSDKQLNSVYNKIIATLDAEAKKNLIASERAWLAYRDAEANFEADANARGGSIAPLIYDECRQTLTEARIKELQNAIVNH